MREEIPAFAGMTIPPADSWTGGRTLFNPFQAIFQPLFFNGTSRMRLPVAA